ncbi:MAG: transglutaminase-like domain-containing protein [Lachnospiraceae bacterium]|nr:transglutaminase-like domain-containing protein [Lachnospiraceae bacterium]
MKINLFSEKKPDKRQTKERRKELTAREKDLERFGVAVADIHTDRAQNRFFLCFIRAVLIFLASYGMVGALASSFGMRYSVPLVVSALFVLAFFSAFLYFNKVTFYLGYIVVFVGFVAYSVRGYWYINSGYQAFMNELYNRYSDYFGMVSVRQATEIITDRFMTVTVAMIFMGWFFSILLNISISGYMNLPITFMLTFFPLQAAFYIDIVPPIQYLIMLLAVYISVALLRYSGHFGLPYRHPKGEEFDRSRSGKGEKKVKHKHVYLASSNGMLLITVYSIVLSTVFLLVTGGLFSSNINGKYISNRVKDTTDDFVKIAVQGSLNSILNRYHATGGLAKGKLGGIGNVNPDFQTDIIARFVPYTSGTVYLKGYTGVYYSDNTFSPIIPDKPVMNEPAMPVSDHYAKMWLGIIDADTYYDYKPYHGFYTGTDKPEERKGIPEAVTKYARKNYDGIFDLLDDEKTLRSFAGGEVMKENYEVLFEPYELEVHEEINPNITEEYEEFVYENFLQYPDYLEEVLSDFCDENDITFDRKKYGQGTFDAGDEGLFKESQMARVSAAADIAKEFRSDFQYTMSPGTTPWDRDVVEYFLTTQKRGYCAHFASSSVLLLRYLGIPARYTEGYAITFTNVQDSNGVEGDVADWQIGGEKYENAGVVEVELPDAAAHAWIEIWLDGYGWVPYEVTPPSDEDELTQSQLSLYNLFSGLIFRTSRNAADAAGDNGEMTDPGDGSDSASGKLKAFFNSIDFLAGPFIWTLGIVVLVVIGSALYKIVKKKMRVRRLIRENKYSEAMLEIYRNIPAGLYRKGLIEGRYPTLREVRDFIVTWISAGVASSLDQIDEDEEEAGKKKKHAVRYKAPGINKEEADRLMKLLEKAAFAPDIFTESEYRTGQGLVKKIRFRRAL